MIKNRITRRAFSKLLGASAATAGMGPGLARAQQSYPSRPVRFVLPFAAAGVADITARLAAEKLGDKLGQRFVVENMPGPGGIAAARAVLSQAADGYTIGLVTNGTAISVAIYKSLPFDPVKDFAPISLIGNFDLVFATNANSEFKSLADFLKAARERPGKLDVGTIAVGGAPKSRGRAVQGAGRPQFPDRALSDDTRRDRGAPAQRHPADDRLLWPDEAHADRQEEIRPVGTSGPQRSPFFTDVPTVAEAGVPGYEVTSWNGTFAPAGTPPEIMGVLNRSIREIVAIPEVKQRYAELGIEARASTPEEVKARLEGDIKKWAALIERAGIQKL